MGMPGKTTSSGNRGARHYDKAAHPLAVALCPSISMPHQIRENPRKQDGVQTVNNWGTPVSTGWNRRPPDLTPLLARSTIFKSVLKAIPVGPLLDKV